MIENKEFSHQEIPLLPYQSTTALIWGVFVATVSIYLEQYPIKNSNWRKDFIRIFEKVRQHRLSNTKLKNESENSSHSITTSFSYLNSTYSKAAVIEKQTIPVYLTKLSRELFLWGMFGFCFGLLLALLGITGPVDLFAGILLYLPFHIAIPLALYPVMTVLLSTAGFVLTIFLTNFIIRMIDIWLCTLVEPAIGMLLETSYFQDFHSKHIAYTELGSLGFGVVFVVIFSIVLLASIGAFIGYILTHFGLALPVHLLERCLSWFTSQSIISAAMYPWVNSIAFAILLPIWLKLSNFIILGMNLLVYLVKKYEQALRQFFYYFSPLYVVLGDALDKCKSILRWFKSGNIKTDNTRSDGEIEFSDGEIEFSDGEIEFSDGEIEFSDGENMGETYDLNNIEEVYVDNNNDNGNAL